jgi:2-dehydropantoate 2-reductase
MKICIVGSGAMGSIFGGNLSKIGLDVVLYDVYKEHIDAINECGLKILKFEHQEIVYPKATDNLKSINRCDLIIVFVKGFQTKDAISAAKELIGGETKVLTLQNGLGNAETIASFVSSERVIVGVTSQGGALVKPGVVEHRAFGDTHLAYYTKKKDRWLEDLAGLFSQAGIKTYAEDNVDSLIWSKLMINVGLNALTAITRLENGKFVETSEGEELVATVIQEAWNIAKNKGINLIYKDPIVECIKLAKNEISKNRSSMLVDVLKRQKTEIDTINGVIVAEADKLGLPATANKMVANLVKVIQSEYSNMIWEL